MNKQIKKTIINLIDQEMNLPVRQLEFLERGITNYNYLLNQHHVIKLKDPLLNVFNSINNEKNMAEHLTKLHLCPRHQFYDTLISVDYLEGVSYLNKDNYLQYFPQLVTILHTIHQLPDRGFTHFSPLDRYHYYRNFVSTNNRLDNEDTIIRQTAHFYEKATLRPCHNDLVNGNILIKDDLIQLIDFEYSGLNDPDFDVVSFLSENDFVDATIKSSFLAQYYGDNIPFEKIKIYTQFANLLWYYWALYAFEHTKRAIFAEIAHIKKLQYNTNLF